MKPTNIRSDAPEPPMLSSIMECSSSNKLGCEVLELEEGAEGVVLECSSSALPTGCVTLHESNLYRHQRTRDVKIYQSKIPILIKCSSNFNASIKNLQTATITWLKEGEEVATGDQYALPDPLDRCQI